MGIRSTEKSSVRVRRGSSGHKIHNVVCAVLGANAHQLWVFIDMLFLCWKSGQGGYHIISLPSSQGKMPI